MRIPKRFSVLGREWSVTLVNKVDSDNAPGEAVLKSRRIRIAKDLSHRERVWVFWHEYFHAFLYEMGVSREDCGLPELAEEMMCDQFANEMMKLNVQFKRLRGKR